MENIKDILRVVPDDLLHKCTRSELLTLIKGEQKIRMQMQTELDKLSNKNQDLEEQIVQIEGKFVRVKNKIFGKSSEKSPKNPARKETKKPKSKDPFRRLPSERYPELPVVEKELELADLPSCRSCGNEMLDGGMTEASEYLTVEPKKYYIVRQVRHKYRCNCHGDIQTTPALPRIRPGSSYSDDMMVDIALSKYCDLIPIDRYSAIAAQQGFENLPANSLIETTHYLAKFLTPAYKQLRKEIESEKVLRADETPHKMLEGDTKSQWYLWGFSGKETCYFECRSTRSGSVASKILKNSDCEVLLTDVFAGYGKAVKNCNQLRAEKCINPIKNAYCNAHARRKFKEAEKKFADEAKFYLDCYSYIYQLEAETKDKSSAESLSIRRKMRSLFEKIRDQSKQDLLMFSAQSDLVVAINYFLKNYAGLVLFLNNPDVPIDNNAQERHFRSYVVGRKTWYGTHSKRGAETSAILFSLIESCKLNKINPRQYFGELIQTIHSRSQIFTPKEFKVKM